MKRLLVALALVVVIACAWLGVMYTRNNPEQRDLRDIHPGDAGGGSPAPDFLVEILGGLLEAQRIEERVAPVSRIVAHAGLRQRFRRRF